MLCRGNRGNFPVSFPLLLSGDLESLRFLWYTWVVESRLVDIKGVGVVPLIGLVPPLGGCLSKGGVVDVTMIDVIELGATGAFGEVDGGVTELVIIVGGGKACVLVLHSEVVAGAGTESLAVEDVLGLCSSL